MFLETSLMRGRLSSLIKFSALSFNCMQESSERTVTEPSSPPHTALRRCRPVLHRWEARQSRSTAGQTPSLPVSHCVEKHTESHYSLQGWGKREVLWHNSSEMTQAAGCCTNLVLMLDCTAAWQFLSSSGWESHGISVTPYCSFLHCSFSSFLSRCHIIHVYVQGNKWKVHKLFQSIFQIWMLEKWTPKYQNH